jgi:hypothetical protein
LRTCVDLTGQSPYIPFGRPVQVSLSGWNSCRTLLMLNCGWHLKTMLDLLLFILEHCVRIYYNKFSHLIQLYRWKYPFRNFLSDFSKAKG